MHSDKIISNLEFEVADLNKLFCAMYVAYTLKKSIAPMVTIAALLSCHWALLCLTNHCWISILYF